MPAMIRMIPKVGILYEVRLNLGLRRLRYIEGDLPEALFIFFELALGSN